MILTTSPVQSARTVSKNGATLQLANVNWSPMGERYDVNSIPRLYNAVANYTGKAYGSKPTAFEATATYTGEVSRLAPGNVLYTLVYEPAGTVPLTAEEQAAKEAAESIDGTVFAWIGGGLLVLAVVGGGVFLLVKSGVFSRPKKPRPPRKPKPPKAPRRPSTTHSTILTTWHMLTRRCRTAAGCGFPRPCGRWSGLKWEAKQHE